MKTQELLGAVVAGELDERAPEVLAAYSANPELIGEVAALKQLARRLDMLAAAHRRARSQARTKLLWLVLSALAGLAAYWLWRS